MPDDPATTRVSLAFPLSRLLLASLFEVREEHFQIEFRPVPPTLFTANPSDVLRSFRPERGANKSAAKTYHPL